MWIEFLRLYFYNIYKYSWLFSATKIREKDVHLRRIRMVLHTSLSPFSLAAKWAVKLKIWENRCILHIGCRTMQTSNVPDVDREWRNLDSFLACILYVYLAFTNWWARVSGDRKIWFQQRETQVNTFNNNINITVIIVDFWFVMKTYWELYPCSFFKVRNTR